MRGIERFFILVHALINSVNKGIRTFVLHVELVESNGNKKFVRFVRFFIEFIKRVANSSKAIFYRNVILSIQQNNKFIARIAN